MGSADFYFAGDMVSTSLRKWLEMLISKGSHRSHWEAVGVARRRYSDLIGTVPRAYGGGIISNPFGGIHPISA